MSDDTCTSKQMSRIFTTSAIKSQDELSEKYERCYSNVASLTNNRTDKEANDALVNAVGRDTKAHEDICLGLLVGILSEPENAVRHYRHLTLVVRDGQQSILVHLTQLVLEKFPHMYQKARHQLLWVTRELIKASISGMDSVCWNLLRLIAGGDVSRSNLWLADSVLDILIENRYWLEKFSFLLASVVYTYLRLIEDHFQFVVLRNKEVQFVVSLLRNRFSDAAVIGRDLLRVLQHISKIPELNKLWHDILYDPTSLSPTFSGVSQLMHTRTSRRFLQSRITPEMEKKILFLTSQVRFGMHKRYQDWFQRQYLSTPESQSLRCDIIRFIVGVIHPTNELLCSDIIPRWAVIGWLLTTCTSTVAAANAKLALFYDWLYFDPEKDNIMNIEPAVLVMHHSMKPHPAITATLLDFVCRIFYEFHPFDGDKVHVGIYNSLRTILDKRVLPSLMPMMDNPKLDKDLRMKLRETFAIFFVNDEYSSSSLEELGSNQVEEFGLKFSDDEDESHTRDQFVESDSKFIKLKPIESISKTELRNDLSDFLSSLQAESGDDEKRCRILQTLISAMISDSLESEQCTKIANRLVNILWSDQSFVVIPSPPTDQSITKSIKHPIFVILYNLCKITMSEPVTSTGRATLLQLLSDLYALRPQVGYFLIYFLKVHPDFRLLESRSKTTIYKQLCKSIDTNYILDICIFNDMRQCQDDDLNLFVYLIPEIYMNFAKHAIGNVNFLYLIVSCVDGQQINKIVCSVIAREYVMFKKDVIHSIIEESLRWETFEQYVLWQFISAHNLPFESMLPSMSSLCHPQHSEALTFFLLLLKKKEPSTEILRNLLSREFDSQDNFVSSALINWIHDCDEKVADLISSQLVKNISSGSKRKRTGGNNKTSLPSSAELILYHLDHLRTVNRTRSNFFLSRSIQTGLKVAQDLCNDEQRKIFGELFSLVDSESDSEDSSTPPLKMSKLSQKNTHSVVGSSHKSPAKIGLSGRWRNGTINVTDTNTVSDSSDDCVITGGNINSFPNKANPSFQDQGVCRRVSESLSVGHGKPKIRKRTSNKISYKKMLQSSDESCDDNNVGDDLADKDVHQISKIIDGPSRWTKKKKNKNWAHSDSD